MRSRKQRSSSTRRWVLQALEERVTPTIYTVQNLNDSGAGSLRAAVASANGHPGDDTIDFKSGMIGTIFLTTGELAVNDELMVQGPGNQLNVIEGNSASRIFSAPSLTLEIHVFTLGHGFTTGDGSAVSCDGSAGRSS